MKRRLGARGLLPLALGGCLSSDPTVIEVTCGAAYEVTSHQVRLPPGSRSHWLQPWRAYQDTWPATRLLDAWAVDATIFYLDADGPALDGAVKALAALGVRQLGFIVSWNHLDFANPGQVANANAKQLLQLCRTLGIRPRLRLEAHLGGPAPNQVLPVVLTRAAPSGADEIQADDATLARAVLGRSGLDDPTSKTMAGLLFVGKDATRGTLKLSRKLAAPLAAGTQPGHLLLYEPFWRPRDASGARNAHFERTMAGWLDYVAAVVRFVRQSYGTGAFDLDLWSNADPAGAGAFLDVNRYYAAPIDTQPGTPEETTYRELQARSLAWLRDPANGAGEVRLYDAGRSRPWQRGASAALPGIEAFLRPAGFKELSFPADGAEADWVDALFAPDSPPFQPSYRALFPEIGLTGLAASPWIFDLSPIATTDGDLRRGRDVASGSGALPATWIALEARGSDGAFEAKALLRALSAYIGKGATRVTSVRSLQSFAGLLDTPKGRSFREIVGSFRGALAGVQPVDNPKSVRLERVSACGAGGRQFTGDGSVAHPSLFDRDVVGFFPFVVAPGRYAVSVYIMGRALPDGAAPGDERTFGLSVRGPRGTGARVSLLDPLTGTTRPLTDVQGDEGGLELRVPLTDVPRWLFIEER